MVRMTEIDYLKCKLEDTKKAFDKLHKRYIELLKQQGNLEKENEQLRKQIQNYEQLISNLYVGEEETLDGWIGKYEIWETDLQKYKEKIKGVCYEQ